jgi:hypothetical protein
MFDGVLPGNISQQVIDGHVLARAVFPLLPAGQQQQQQLPLLKVLLFDPEDLAHASTARTAAAIAAAAAASRRRLALPGSNGRSSPTPAAAAGRGSPPLPAPSSSSSSSPSQQQLVPDIGGAEVDVLKLLAAATDGRSVGGAVGVPGPGNAPVSAAAATASWEGWVKLDRDGGHLLLRITQLPACQLADVVPPPGTAAAADAAAAAGAGAAAKAPAAAAAGTPAAAAGAAAGAAGGSALDDNDLNELLSAVVRKGAAQVQDQVRVAAGSRAALTCAPLHHMRVHTTALLHTRTLHTRARARRWLGLCTS